MPHLQAKGPEDLSPLREALPRVFLSRDASEAWIPWDVKGVDPVWTHSSARKGKIIHRLALPSRTPHGLAGEVLPRLGAAAGILPGYKPVGGSVPPTGWQPFSGEVPRRLLWTAPPPPGTRLEIGFGNGERLAKASQSAIWWGIENSRRCVDAALSKRIPGLRILHASASLVLPHLPDGIFERILILCPDPWPKERHKGRRWLDGRTLPHLVRTLARGGVLGLTTDHPLLAQVMDRLLPAAAGLSPIDPEDGWEETKYARRGGEEGRALRRWAFSRNASPAGATRRRLDAEHGPPLASPTRVPTDPTAGGPHASKGGIIKVQGGAVWEEERILHLLHVDPQGEDQHFLLVFTDGQWGWDPLTAPLPTPSLSAALGALERDWGPAISAEGGGGGY